MRRGRGNGFSTVSNADVHSSFQFAVNFADGHTIEKMRVEWKKGFDQSRVTEHNYISLAQFEYAVFFEENYEEEIASGTVCSMMLLSCSDM